MSRHFVQSHSLHSFSKEDDTDYSYRDEYFIQSLKAMENVMDIDAYIIDYKNERILYATNGSSLNIGNNNSGTSFTGLSYLDRIIFHEDLPNISRINYSVYDFFYSLPQERRLNCYFTQDFRIQTKQNRTTLINHKGTILDLTNDGTLRLTLCIISYPTNDKPGNAYIKMTDTNTVYEFMQSSQKFIEIKNQKLTSQTTAVLKLASNGKTEAQIANILGISIYTVKYHKKRIFAQLGVKNTVEAIQWMNNQKKMIKR